MAKPFKIPSGKWRGQVRISDFPAESRTFSTRSDALIWIARRTVKLRDIRYGHMPQKTLQEAIDRYMSEESPKKGWCMGNLQITGYSQEPSLSTTSQYHYLYRHFHLSKYSLKASQKRLNHTRIDHFIGNV